MIRPNIAAAAVRVGERIFSGTTHFEAVGKIMQLPDVTAEEKVKMMLAGEDGFVTDEGRFLTRDEAFAVAKHSP